MADRLCRIVWYVHRILSAADHNRRMVPAFDSLSRPDTGDHPVPFYASGSDKNRDHGTSGPVLLPPEEETVQEIKEIVSPILATYGDTKLYYDILRTGRKLWISVYITMNRDMISISKFKSVQKEIIQALSKEYQDFYFELLPDIEYTGDTEVPEPVPDEEET